MFAFVRVLCLAGLVSAVYGIDGGSAIRYVDVEVLEGVSSTGAGTAAALEQAVVTGEGEGEGEGAWYWEGMGCDTGVYDAFTCAWTFSGENVEPPVATGAFGSGVLSAEFWCETIPDAITTVEIRHTVAHPTSAVLMSRGLVDGQPLVIDLGDPKTPILARVMTPEACLPCELEVVISSVEFPDGEIRGIGQCCGDLWVDPEVCVGTPVEVAPLHRGDQNGDAQVSLSELLRVIQFFNSGGLHCTDSEAKTEDGYAPGPGPYHYCERHSSDFNGGASWTIDMTELLRFIQFFNGGGCHYCPGAETEDGFCPGPP